jgi:hypothetical protein
MRVELMRPMHPDQEWRIAVNGLSVVAFAGPGAAERAADCFHELNERLVATENRPPPPELDSFGDVASGTHRVG